MNPLPRVETPIFLHFINREASDAVQRSRLEADDLLIVDVLISAHCAGLSVNISQLLEYTHGRETLTRALVKLFNEKILIPTSHDPTIEDFLENRQKLYGHIANRYPMYFGSDKALLQFDIGKVNNFSMSTLLRRDILHVDVRELPLFAPRAILNDKMILLQHLDPLQMAVMRNKDAAVTKDSIASLLSPHPLADREIGALGRIFSAQYFEHYEKQNMLAGCTGITSAGYVDNLTNFPSFDFPVLNKLLRLLGWGELRTNSREFSAELVSTYESDNHRLFVRRLHGFLMAVYADVKARSNNFEITIDTVQTIRSYIYESASRLLTLDKDLTSKGADGGVDKFYRSRSDTLLFAASIGGAKSMAMKLAWENSMEERRLPKFLLLTATDAETDAVLKILVDAGFLKSDYFPVGDHYALKFEKSGKYDVFHVQSAAGSTGVHGSTVVSLDAIRTLAPDYVISVGICFGLKEDKHSLGDILISDKIIDYETVRLGEKEFRERGTRIPPLGKLFGGATRIRGEFIETGKKAVIGEIICGQKLVDNSTDRAELKRRFPDAVGGEMEANGVLAASLRERRDWLVVKAICDWGMAKGDGHHVTAAQNAVQFTVRLMDVVSLSPIDK